MKRAHSLKAKQSTHNRSSSGSSPDEPTIDQLRKIGKWPFPEWKNGKMVVLVITDKIKRRPGKYSWVKKMEDAPF